MPGHRLLDSLNDAQREAVTAPLGPVLVLAGAGSGKTRVLTHRAAWLILEHGVSPHGLMAVTFTNKAAAEMRGRIESLLGISADPLWIGTFHGLAHRMLRRHWREAGLPPSFQIIDEDDQQRLVRKIIREQNLDEQRWVPREVQGFINAHKDEGRRSKKLDDRGDPTRKQLIRLYSLYEARCELAGVVDFAELLLRSYETLQNLPDLGAYYRERFRHILVDEFQDTNGIQYEWLKLLAGKTGAPYVVADDDQSIYGWRGARVENVQHFRREFGAAVYRLEQNYRSTQVILSAANAVIARNTDRMGKQLWTSVKGGEPIRVYAAFNERDEADFVIESIREHARRGLPLAAAAVLYRSNAQS
ncbi:MAG: UvrD-helicase domain-containing protein, partial [Gammaproteobacteria bacterium]